MVRKTYYTKTITLRLSKNELQIVSKLQQEFPDAYHSSSDVIRDALWTLKDVKKGVVKP